MKINSLIRFCSFLVLVPSTSMFHFIFGQSSVPNSIQSIYDFKVKALSGGELDFNSYKGKKILIVNTASRCGYTHQYKGLQSLQEMFKDKLVIVGFPSNDFLLQEPGSNEEIAHFCEVNYGVSFPMAAKIKVKGKKMHPLYIWLTNKNYNNLTDSKVKWNFQKYLINEQGNLINIFEPGTEPLSDEILQAIKS